MGREIGLNEKSFNPEFLKKTRELFSKLAGRELSDEECASGTNNMIALELLLRKLAVKYA